jgi:hypothetical protein
MNAVDIPQYTLITYSRDKNNTPRGVLVAVKTGDNGEFNIGYAQCRKGDRFSKKLGLKIAIGRAYTDVFNSIDGIPHHLRKMLPRFIQRCEKYYKVKV